MGTSAACPVPTRLKLGVHFLCMPLVYFYDLPVYRLPRKAYYAEREDYVEKGLAGFGSPGDSQATARNQARADNSLRVREHREREFGGCWEYNEIIGYIRLHFMFSQVRGEYYAVDKSRVVRTRAKTFENKLYKLAPPVEISAPFGNPEILTAIRSYISSCRRILRRRHIDSTLFEATAPYLHWDAFYRQRG